MTTGEMIKQIFVDDVAPAIGTALLALAGVLGTKLVKWIGARTHNEKIDGFVSRLNDAAQTGVSALEQTMVATLKSRSGGKLTEADAAAVKEAAVKLVKDHLGGDKGVAQAQKLLGIDDLTPILNARIESWVREMSSGQTAAK